MPRTSKKQFDDALRKEIWKSSLQEIKKADASAGIENFLNKFLTEDERMILEKRLAVFYFLSRGESLRETSRNADVSRKTVIFVKRGLKKYKPQSRTYSKFYKTRNVPRHRMPVYKGKGRWDFLNNY